MAQDYYIYIKGGGFGGSGGGASQFDNTKPFANRESYYGDDETSNFVPNTMNAINKTQSFLAEGFKGAMDTGVAALAKAVPWIAIVIAAAKITDKITTAVGDGFSTYNGNYEFSMQYNNVKASLSNFINPIGYAINQRRLHEQWNLQNKEIQQRQNLTGAITRVGITNKGV